MLNNADYYHLPHQLYSDCLLSQIYLTDLDIYLILIYFCPICGEAC